MSIIANLESAIQTLRDKRKDASIAIRTAGILRIYSLDGHRFICEKDGVAVINKDEVVFFPLPAISFIEIRTKL